VSRKLRALMQLGPIEAPAAGTATGLGQLPELRHVLIHVIAARKTLQILAHQLVEAFPQGNRLLAGLLDDTLIDGERQIRGPHLIRAHG
jgi:hypothetical protein